MATDSRGGKTTLVQRPLEPGETPEQREQKARNGVKELARALAVDMARRDHYAEEAARAEARRLVQPTTTTPNLPQDGPSEAAHALLSRFRKDLQTALKAGRSSVLLLDDAGTLVGSLERLGAGERMLNEGRVLSEKAMTLRVW